MPLLILLYWTPSNFEDNFREAKKVNYTTVQVWELPDELEEISGIAWITDNVLAAIQDEDGILFIYDLDKKEILREIEFAGDGDYEGVAIHGTDAYVMRSDGILFEILNFEKDDSLVNTFETTMTDDDNVESLTLDRKNNRLLMAPKDRDGDKKTYKGIYAFDLDARKMLPEAVHQIGMTFKEFKAFEKKKSYDTFRPSDLAVHPQTGDLYVLEGVRPKLIQFDDQEKPKHIFLLDKEDFRQPEGICFSPEGRLFISNEASGKTATIVELKLN